MPTRGVVYYAYGEQVNGRLRGLLTLLVSSPEFQVDYSNLHVTITGTTPKFTAHV